VFLPAFLYLEAGGLGLPLCREIVEAHGGRLRIERREGGGTAVVCWIPG
jgi:signal transduction histidine kinase